MIQFRKKHDIIRKFTGHCSLGFPEIQIITPDANSKILRIIYAGRNKENTKDDIICLAVNVYWEEQEFILPEIPLNMSWYAAADTGERYLSNTIPVSEDEMPPVCGGKINMAPRSVCVLMVK